MKDIIEQQRVRLLNFVEVGHPLRSEIEMAFNAMQVEADFVVASLEGDAGRFEIGARKLAIAGSLLSRFAKVLRYYARRLCDSGVVAVAEAPRLIVLPGSSEPDWRRNGEPRNNGG